MPCGCAGDISRFIDLVLQTLCLVLGYRVCREPDLHFLSRLGADLGLLTQEGESRWLAVPDLAVMPPSWTLSEARERTVNERIIHMDGDDPAPELVVEVVSRSTEAKDFEDDLSLYAALGIPEYLLIETGEFKTDSNMWLFRRADTDGAYHMAESGLTLTACSTPCASCPRRFPATCPCSSARTWTPGVGMITRGALNAERRSTPPSAGAGCRLACRCRVPHPAPAGRARPPARTPGNAVRTGGYAWQVMTVY